MNIIEAIDNPKLFGPLFKDKATWQAWRSFLKTLFGLELSEAETTIFNTCTGRTTAPVEPFSEAWLICGRRSGKSYVCALIAVFLACFRDYRKYLSPGETGIVMVLACDRKQARVIMKYVVGMLESVPALKTMIVSSSAESVELNNRLNIEVITANTRAPRGYTVVAALCDEISFWRGEDSMHPDDEILAALRPSMATIPGSLLIGLSSPYAKRGVLYQAYADYFASDDAPVLVWQGDTRTMNPSVPQKVIDQAYARDPQAASAEYGALFRTDIEQFLSRDILEPLTINETVLPPLPNIQYHAFCDASGGVSDAYTMAIAHSEDGTTVLDLLVERKPPFSPEAVTSDFCAILKQYHVSSVTGDRYGGEWPREQFRKQGVDYRISEFNRSEIYLEFLPLVMAGRVRLLRSNTLLNQLCGLERRTSRNGKDSIDHGPGQHDDLANSAAGALVLCAGRNYAPLNLEGFGVFGLRDTSREFSPNNYPDYESHVASMLDDDFDDGEATSSVFGRGSPWS